MTVSLMLFIVLVAINGVDVYTTLRIVQAGGREGNPLLAPLVKRMGVVPALLVVKVPLLAVAWFFLRPYPWIMLVLCWVFLAVCVWNYSIIRKHNL